MKDGYRHSQKKGVPSGSRLCSDHFKDSDYITPPGAPRKMLKSGSVPTVFNTESFKNRKRKRLACDYGVVSEESSIVSNRIMDAADEIKPTQSSNGAEHGYCKPALVSKEESDATVSELKKKLRALQKQTQRQHVTQINDLQDLLDYLKNRQMIDESVAQMISTNFQSDVLESRKVKHANPSEAVIARQCRDSADELALTLLYFSPAAYEWARQKYALPNVRTLRSWLSNEQGEPGFLIDTLGLATQTNESRFSLIIHSVPLKKQTSYDGQLQKIRGFCDYGGLITGDTYTEASHLLLFLLGPVDRAVRSYPIGYFFVDKIHAQVLAELIKTALTLTAERNMRICSISTDCSATNISTFEILGCSFIPSECHPSFKHPMMQSQVYIIFDVPNISRLIRNALSELKDFVTWNDERISWKYFQKLFDASFPISNPHWGKVKINICSELFTNAVADLLQSLQKSKVPGFEGSRATVKFIRKVAQAVEILTSNSLFNKGYQFPLTTSNVSQRRQILNDFSSYILSLRTTDGLELWRSKAKTFLHAFVSTSESILHLSRYLLLSGGCRYVPTNQFSLKPAEHFLSKISCIIGSKDWLTADEVTTAIKKLFVDKQTLINSSTHSLDCDSTSGVMKQKYSDRSSSMVAVGIAEVSEDYFSSASSLSDASLYKMSAHVANSLKQHICCESCAAAMLDVMFVRGLSDDHYLSQTFRSYNLLPRQGVKSCCGIVQPSQATFRVVERCEQIYRQTVLSEPTKYLGSHSPVHLLSAVYRRYAYEERPLTPFNHECDVEMGLLSHTNQLTNCIITKFFELRLKKLSFVQAQLADVNLRGSRSAVACHPALSE